MLRRKNLVRQLQEQTAAYFKKKKLSTLRCGYILKEYKDWKNNLILPEVADYIDRKREESSGKVPFPLHKYIHHGLSSQACLFNLMGQLLVSKDFIALKEIIGLSGLKLQGNVCSAELEFSAGKIFNENRGQPTSVDLYVQTDKNEKVFIEFKFTEAEFGTCSVYEDGDCDGMNPDQDLNLCYLHRLQRKYMVLMKKYDLLKNYEYCPFTEFYQAYRLLLSALESEGQCYFMLIHDKRNPTFFINDDGKNRGRFVRFKSLLPEEIRKRVFILTIQQIVGYLKEHKKSDWLIEFQEKYL